MTIASAAMSILVTEYMIRVVTGSAATEKDPTRIREVT